MAGDEEGDVVRQGNPFVVGLAAQATVDAMEGGVSLAQGPASYVFLGQRLIRGWAIEIVLVAMLLPFLAAAVDLFARCRRRRISIARTPSSSRESDISGPRRLSTERGWTPSVDA